MRDKKINISVRVSEQLYEYLVKCAEEEKRSLSSLCDIWLNKQAITEKTKKEK